MVTAIVVSQVFIPQIQSINTTEWSTGEVALWSVITLVAISGFVYNVAAAFGMV